MRISELLNESVTRRLDPTCWKGNHKEGTKMKGPMKDVHGKPTRKALSLRKWNC